MRIHQEIPDVTEVELGSLVERLREPPVLGPFSEPAMEFCSALSRALFADAAARQFPAAMALAYRIRKAELVSLRSAFSALESEETLLFPRGLVFHLPPGNVDTMFIYSWLYSFLVGNRNVVRLPTRSSPQVDAICDVYRRLLRDAPDAVRSNTVMVRYGHEREITGALSAGADVRVIWGGDATIEAVRTLPLPPHARELTFADRFSLCAIRADAWHALDPGGRRQLAEGFFNDAFWFDQLGCSSPRLVVWCSQEGTREAASEFYRTLREVVDARGYRLDAGTALSKMTFAFRAALDRPVTGCLALGNEVTVLPVSALEGFDRTHCGAGLFFQFEARDLAELVAFVRRKDQTLTHFGFSAVDLRRLASRLNGLGLDRIVPVGQALSFDRFWDGCDLLREFTRTVAIRATCEEVSWK